jgi:hypothetical protein
MYTFTISGSGGQLHDCFFQDVFDFNHKQVVELIRSAGTTLNLTIERSVGTLWSVSHEQVSTKLENFLPS